MCEHENHPNSLQGTAYSFIKEIFSHVFLPVFLPIIDAVIFLCNMTALQYTVKKMKIPCNLFCLV